MELNKILTSLCYYDVRNPDGTKDDEEIQDHKENLLKESKKTGKNYGCYCDNCFRGKTELAEDILRLMEKM